MVSTARAGRQVAVWSSSLSQPKDSQTWSGQGESTKRGCAVLNADMDGEIAGVHIIVGVRFEGKDQLGVGVAMDQLGTERGAPVWPALRTSSSAAAAARMTAAKTRFSSSFCVVS